VRGEAFRRSGEPAQALPDFDAFLAFLASESAMAETAAGATTLWRRSRCHLEMGQLQEAIADSQAALALGQLMPLERADCWLVTAKGKMRLALDAEEVAKACTSALLDNPRLHEAMLIRGQAQLQLGFFAACDLDCSQALSACPDSATPWATRGRARLRQKCYRESVEDCERALDLDPECRLAMSTLGAALLQLGHNEKALENCDRAVVFMLARLGKGLEEEEEEVEKSKKRKKKGKKGLRKKRVESKKRPPSEKEERKPTQEPLEPLEPRNETETEAEVDELEAEAEAEVEATETEAATEAATEAEDADSPPENLDRSEIE
ncbi:unnamed protein product, partial [Effrenium voratum]